MRTNKCPRCGNSSFVTHNEETPKCLACGHTKVEISKEISDEVKNNIGKNTIRMAKSSQYFR